MFSDDFIWLVLVLLFAHMYYFTDIQKLGEKGEITLREDGVNRTIENGKLP